MFTKLDKAIVAAILAGVFILQTNGIVLPDFLTEAWVTSAVALAMPIVVYFFPNKG